MFRKLFVTVVLFFSLFGGAYMPNGSQDGGYSQYQGQTANQSDPGQAADRILGGFGSVQKTGHVIWTEGFEMPVAVAAAGVVPPSLFNVVEGLVVPGKGAANYEASWQGLNYLRFLTQAVLNDTAQASKAFDPTIETGNWGMEFMFIISQVGAANFQNMLFQINFVQESAVGQQHAAVIRFTVGTGNPGPITLSYENAAGAFIQIDTLTNLIIGRDSAWQYAKLVVNPQTNTYERFYFGSKVYNLHGIPMFPSGAATTNNGFFTWVLSTTDAVAKQAGIDNLVLTCDEP